MGDAGEEIEREVEVEVEVVLDFAPVISVFMVPESLHFVKFSFYFR